MYSFFFFFFFQACLVFTVPGLMPHSDQRLHRAQLTRSDPVSHPESSLLNQTLAPKKELLNLCTDCGHDHPCKCYCTQTHSNLTEGKERSCSMPLNKQPRQSAGAGQHQGKPVLQQPFTSSSHPLLLLVCPPFVSISKGTVFLGGVVCALFSLLKANTKVTTG